MKNEITPQRPNVEYPKKTMLNPDWIVGFIDGEGCFHIGINKNSGVKFGYQILPEITVVQHKSDINILYQLKTAMGCGVVRRNHEERYCWRVRDLDNLSNVIVPFFEKHPLKTKKNVEFKKFARVVRLMKEGKHLISSGFNEISKIASEMNRKSIRIKIESTP